MNKTEIQSRIEKCESREAYLQREHDALKSELATLKADLAQAEFAKCDCEDKAQAGGIEQEKCWHALDSQGDVRSASARTQRDCKNYFSPMYRPAYMPECRQLTAEDAERGHAAMCVGNTWLDSARELHKLGFRIKVTP